MIDILTYMLSLLVGASDILFFGFTVTLAVFGIFAFVIRLLRREY